MITLLVITLFILIVAVTALWPEIYLFALLFGIKFRRYLER